MGKEQELITKAELARRLKVSPPMVSKYCRKKFVPAIVGDQIDFNHIAIQEHIQQRETAAKAEQASNFDSPNPIAPTLETSGDISFADIDGIEELTVRQVVEKYGSIPGFKIYIDAMRGLADWKNKELKYLTGRGEVIEVEPLATTLFSLIDLSFKRIVSEFPGAIAPQLRAIVQSAGDMANIEMIALMEEQLSQTIKGIKKKVTRELKNATK